MSVFRSFVLLGLIALGGCDFAAEPIAIVPSQIGLLSEREAVDAAKEHLLSREEGTASARLTRQRNGDFETVRAWQVTFSEVQVEGENLGNPMKPRCWSRWVVYVDARTGDFLQGGSAGTFAPCTTT